MYTSVMCLALSAGFVPSAAMIPAAPSWRSDYSLAVKEGQRDKRPLAVFVGSGAEGWDRLSKDGGLDKEARELLRTHYVCVYLDSSKERDRRLADQLELSDGRGVVLSDVSGEKQAFWHAGTLSNEQLNHYLRKYSDPAQVVTRTEMVAQARPQAQPVYSPPPAYYAPAFRSFGGCST
jgi:hypothetical protein